MKTNVVIIFYLLDMMHSCDIVKMFFQKKKKKAQGSIPITLT